MSAIDETLRRVRELGEKAANGPRAWGPAWTSFDAHEACTLLPRLAKAVEILAALAREHSKGIAPWIEGNIDPDGGDVEICITCLFPWPCDFAEALASAEQALSDSPADTKETA